MMNKKLLITIRIIVTVLFGVGIICVYNSVMTKEKPLIIPKRSYVKVLDGNPTLFVGEKPLDILGLRTTSDPYESKKAYQNVIEYINKAAKYGYNYVAVKLSWYRMDTTKHNTFPKPEDVGKLMDWKKIG